MSTTYYFYVGTPVDIASRVTTLDSKLSIDLDISTNYTSTVYNGTTENVEVTYSSPLSSTNTSILNGLADIVLYDAVVGKDIYVSNPDSSVRKSYGTSSAPTSTHDVNFGYAVGSIVITNASEIYMCIDNTAGNAIWAENLQASQTMEIVSTTETSTTSKNYTTLADMKVTPSAGTYDVRFSSYCQTSSRNAQCSYALFVNGVIVSKSQRSVNTGNTNTFATLYSQSIISVNGAQTIEVKYHVSTGICKVFDRSLIWVRNQ